MWLRQDTSYECVCVSVFRCGPMFCCVCNFVVITKVTKADLFLTEAKQYFNTLLSGNGFFFLLNYFSEFHYNMYIIFQNKPLIIYIPVLIIYTYIYVLSRLYYPKQQYLY